MQEGPQTWNGLGDLDLEDLGWEDLGWEDLDLEDMDLGDLGALKNSKKKLSILGLGRNKGQKPSHGSDGFGRPGFGRSWNFKKLQEKTIPGLGSTRISPWIWHQDQR